MSRQPNHDPVFNDTYRQAQVEVLNAIGNHLDEYRGMPESELLTLAQDAIVFLVNIRQRYANTHSMGAAKALELVAKVNAWQAKQVRR